MSGLLFLDESGHDHKNCPYEVRGGVAVHVSKLWPLVQRLQSAELSAFGANMREYSKELKGSKLLDKDRLKWAKQTAGTKGKGDKGSQTTSHRSRLATVSPNGTIAQPPVINANTAS